MTRRYWMVKGLVFLSLGGAIFLIESMMQNNRSLLSPTGKGAGLEVPAVVDVGSVANGSIVQVPLRIANHGPIPVKLTGFHASCTCMKLYIIRDTAKVTLSSLIVDPGSAETIYTDLRVSGDAGLTQGSAVAFRESGDSARSEGDEYLVPIRFTPVARTYTIPQTLAFGEVPLRAPASQRVQLRSDGTFRGDIGVISCSRPDLFAVEFEAASAEDRGEFALSVPGGQHLLGSLNITLKPQTLGFKVNEVLTIKGNGQELCQIPVSASPTPEYRLLPDTLVLPRVGSRGAAYSATVRCVARSVGRFRIAPDDKPGPFTITVSNAEDDGGTHSIAIRYDGPLKRRERQDYVLHFKINASGMERRLSLPVVILPPSG